MSIRLGGLFSRWFGKKTAEEQTSRPRLSECCSALRAPTTIARLIRMF